MTAQEAGERYAALASPEMHHLLVVEMGWSPERHREWLTETVVAQLLGRRDAPRGRLTRCRGTPQRSGTL